MNIGKLKRPSKAPKQVRDEENSDRSKRSNRSHQRKNMHLKSGRQKESTRASNAVFDIPKQDIAKELKNMSQSMIKAKAIRSRDNNTSDAEK